MSLDERFGPCRAPGSAILDHEHRARPLSRVELVSENLPVIQAYLDRSAKGPSAIFSKSYHLLWIMDEAARVFVAVEELIDARDRPVGALPLALDARPVRAIKLGHPTLLDTEPRHARIGGEIVYDPDWDQNAAWVLTNKSGRYGLRFWQREEHLRNVHGIFMSNGVYIGMRFLRPTS